MRSFKKALDIAMIMCAGKGERAGLNYNKLFFKSGGKTILEHTLEKFSGFSILLVINQTDCDTVKALIKDLNNIRFTVGGETRTDSVKCGLNYIEKNYGNIDTVLIHDGARPNIDVSVIKGCLNSAKKYGSGVAFAPCVDTVRSKNGEKHLKRDDLMCLQTPQAFDFKKLLSAYNAFGDNLATDDSEVYEKLYGKCEYILSSHKNYKITSADDLLRFDKDNMKNFEYRTGNGYDIHKLVENRPLILGGVNIPYPLGLLGHSDADALIHSVMDSLLSAIGEKDIGCHFPDSESRYHGADSLVLLKSVSEIVKSKGYEICNLTCTVIAQKPKLSPYADEMKANILTTLNITDSTAVGLSFNTNEGLDAIGKGEGIACYAVCLLKKNY